MGSLLKVALFKGDLVNLLSSLLTGAYTELFKTATVGTAVPQKTFDPDLITFVQSILLCPLYEENGTKLRSYGFASARDYLILRQILMKSANEVLNLNPKISKSEPDADLVSHSKVMKPLIIDTLTSWTFATCPPFVQMILYQSKHSCEIAGKLFTGSSHTIPYRVHRYATTALNAILITMHTLVPLCFHLAARYKHLAVPLKCIAKRCLLVGVKSWSATFMPTDDRGLPNRKAANSPTNSQEPAEWEIESSELVYWLREKIFPQINLNEPAPPVQLADGDREQWALEGLAVWAQELRRLGTALETAVEQEKLPFDWSRHHSSEYLNSFYGLLEWASSADKTTGTNPFMTGFRNAVAKNSMAVGGVAISGDAYD